MAERSNLLKQRSLLSSKHCLVHAENLANQFSKSSSLYWCWEVDARRVVGRWDIPFFHFIPNLHFSLLTYCAFSLWSCTAAVFLVRTGTHRGQRSLPAQQVCLPGYLSQLCALTWASSEVPPRSFWQVKRSLANSIFHTRFGHPEKSSEFKLYKNVQNSQKISLSVSVRHVSHFPKSPELYRPQEYCKTHQHPQNPENANNALCIAASSLNPVPLFPSKSIVCRTWSVFRPTLLVGCITWGRQQTNRNEKGENCLCFCFTKMSTNFS